MKIIFFYVFLCVINSTLGYSDTYEKEHVENVHEKILHLSKKDNKRGLRSEKKTYTYSTLNGNNRGNRENYNSRRTNLAEVSQIQDEGTSPSSTIFNRLSNLKVQEMMDIPKSMEYQRFRKILGSELDTDLDLSKLANKENTREGFSSLNPDDVEPVWRSAIQFEWERAADAFLVSLKSSKRNKNRQHSTGKSVMFPFTVCSMERTDSDSNMNHDKKSGFARKNEIMSAIETIKKDSDIDVDVSDIPLYNGNDGLCLSTSMTFKAAKSLGSELKKQPSSDEIYIQPLPSLAKLRRETAVSLLSQDTARSTTVNSNSPLSNENVKLVVEFCSAGNGMTKNGAYTLANQIISRIQNSLETERRVLLENDGENQEHYDTQSLIQNSFLWTAHDSMSEHHRYLKDTNMLDDNHYSYLPSESSSSESSRHLSQFKHERAEMWRSRLQMSLQPEHSCVDILKTVSIHVHQFGGKNGRKHSFLGEFEFIIEDTNTLRDLDACYFAFIAGLSTQTEICSIEKSASFVELNDHSQWILQTGGGASSETPDTVSRPWYDVGLTGKGEIIQISDSGLDTENCYFYSSIEGDIKKDGSINYNHRKVISYYPYADAETKRDDHGTHVVGTAVGRKSLDGKTDDSGMVDGVAIGAKVAFFDIGNGYGKSPTLMDISSCILIQCS